MSEDWSRRWALYAPRERAALLLLAAVSAILITYFVLWQPAHVASGKLKIQVATMRADLGRMEASARQYQIDHAKDPQSFRGPSAAGTLATTPEPLPALAASLKTDGMPAVTPRVLADGFEVDMAGVDYGAWIVWLEHASRAAALTVATAKVVRRADGRVDTSVTFRSTH